MHLERKLYDYLRSLHGNSSYAYSADGFGYYKHDYLWSLSLQDATPEILSPLYQRECNAIPDEFLPIHSL